MRRVLSCLAAAGVVASIAISGTGGPAAAEASGPATIAVSASTTVDVSSLVAAPSGDAWNAAGPERTGPKRLGTSPLRSAAGDGTAVVAAGAGSPASAATKTKSNPNLVTDWEGVNHRDSRLAFGGNQFSGEPADQGLCAGNGYVMESVNSALRVYDTAGTPLTPVLALNEFYGFPPAIDRSSFTFGPFTFDISCHYDPDSNRWFHLAVDLDQDPVTGAFTGKNYLDLAVSTSGDPTGTWTVYRIPGMNDGTEGTPDHDCPGGPCFADFPHIGVDANGVFITTNEFPLFADGFIGAQVYAISKSALVAGTPDIDVLLFNTADDPVRPGEPGFTVWPAKSAGTQFAESQNGTQYFVSSNAVFDAAGVSDEIIVWSLSNTESLDSGSPALTLRKSIVPSLRYAVPPSSAQRPGSIPYGELFEGATAPGPIDTSDSRVLDVRYANGKLWAVLGTAARAEGSSIDRAGVAWFVLDASTSARSVRVRTVKSGILALADEALAYPTLAVTASGRGVIGFTRVSETLYPSTGYASIDAVSGVGAVGMIEEGDSPNDGFTEYSSRPRWGDYGAAAVDGDTVYLANQYVEQDPCTVAQFIATSGQCPDASRTQFANWSTRVAALTP